MFHIVTLFTYDRSLFKIQFCVRSRFVFQADQNTFFFSYILLKLSKELYLNKAITTYLCKLESRDSIQTNEMHVIVILLTRHLNTKYQLIIQALF